jgi:NAD+ synthase (glutamine-hydrolysing)
MEMLARILEDETCHDILLDIGLPVTHRNVNYNCRVVCLDGKILFIRPKMCKCSSRNLHAPLWLLSDSQPI